MHSSSHKCRISDPAIFYRRQQSVTKTGQICSLLHDVKQNTHHDVLPHAKSFHATISCHQLHAANHDRLYWRLTQPARSTTAGRTTRRSDAHWPPAASWKRGLQTIARKLPRRSSRATNLTLQSPEVNVQKSTHCPHSTVVRCVRLAK